MSPPPPRSTLFPYTTLFRSRGLLARARQAHLQPRRAAHPRPAVPPPPARPRGAALPRPAAPLFPAPLDRKSTRLNSSHITISYAVFCLKKKKKKISTSQDHT